MLLRTIFFTLSQVNHFTKLRNISGHQNQSDPQSQIHGIPSLALLAATLNNVRLCFWTPSPVGLCEARCIYWFWKSLPCPDRHIYKDEGVQSSDLFQTVQRNEFAIA